MNSIATASIEANNELVTFKNETPVVSHYIISEKTWIDKSSIQSLIRQHSSDLEDFWALGFEIRVLPAWHWTARAKEYFLNEQQATLIMTYLRNNEIVREFKKNLVRAFFQLREKQSQPLLPPIQNLNAEQMIDLLDHIWTDGLIKMIKTSLNLGWMYYSASKMFQKNQEKLEELVKKQEQEISELKANNNKHKALQTSISELAQAEILMSMEEVGILLWMSRNKLYQEMRFRKFLKKDNAPYKYYDWEYFIQKKVSYKKWKSKNIWQYMQTFILPKWLELLKSIFLKQQAI